jgi:hypothetical protein
VWGASGDCVETWLTSLIVEDLGGVQGLFRARAGPKVFHVHADVLQVRGVVVLRIPIWRLVHADSAGCSLGRFNHWWRSESEPVFGEGGFHTSLALASTVLLGHL